MPVSVSRSHPGSSPGEDRHLFIRQEAAAQRWDVSVDTIRRLIAAGKVTGYRLNGRIIRVNVAEVDACFKPVPSAAMTTLGGDAA